MINAIPSNAHHELDRARGSYFHLRRGIASIRWLGQTVKTSSQRWGLRIWPSEKATGSISDMEHFFAKQGPNSRTPRHLCNHSKSRHCLPASITPQAPDAELFLSSIGDKCGRPRLPEGSRMTSTSRVLMTITDSVKTSLAATLPSSNLLPCAW